MREKFNNLINQIRKLFFGILFGFGIELFFGVGLSYFLEKFITNDFDQQLFVIHYPLSAILILSTYLIFWKKQYTIVAGIFLGAILFIFLLAFLLTGV
ncbi:MAG: hypothetical protein A2402_01550 [Candidatus Staskawiczbacteria bacterium RIFOXYC1_FULL_37_43]|nr:MAG: hypothetical protein A2813_00060 [Candidatus Staskawiczbacteria bacterium RIFCSPHIGHO2_01_FULL_37_17]OGZ72132.1 MAG: hypothetical protein A2891_01900 [Candidatus Staskawiczbacteria bacterium RIFCSPLOWO2_01_FULL_37_19]OGZ75499.1 MAG: hypothetical protein A2205_01845 [Candidatus Staskawiczbacteria bacterium RIFOXYA1_FULL_37_15]OGZ77529.1 MAG: hypothetical protein A2280_01850 [Candidatus Staskawiczbacteria bacterium RIFOXYA12_FULL_37_10]OGZ80487.1 MAG: hypothetical protein A2353_03110 [Can